MSDIFDIYQENINNSFVMIDKEISKDSTKDMNIINQKLNEINQLIKDLEIQLSTNMLDKSYSKKVSQLKDKYQQYKSKIYQEQDEKCKQLLGLDKNKNTVNNSCESLEQAKRIMLGIEDKSNNIMNELNKQNYTMKNINSSVSSLNHAIDSSTTTINKLKIHF